MCVLSVYVCTCFACVECTCVIMCVFVCMYVCSCLCVLKACMLCACVRACVSLTATCTLMFHYPETMTWEVKIKTRQRRGENKEEERR